VSKKPELVVVAGPNGSGKTSITDQLLIHTWTENCRYINPDVIAQNEFGDWNSPEASLKAARKAEQLRETCLLEKSSSRLKRSFPLQIKSNTCAGPRSPVSSFAFFSSAPKARK